MSTPQTQLVSASLSQAEQSLTKAVELHGRVQAHLDELAAHITELQGHIAAMRTYMAPGQTTY